MLDEVRALPDAAVGCDPMDRDRPRPVVGGQQVPPSRVDRDVAGSGAIRRLGAERPQPVPLNGVRPHGAALVDLHGGVEYGRVRRERQVGRIGGRRAGTHREVQRIVAAEGADVRPEPTDVAAQRHVGRP